MCALKFHRVCLVIGLSSLVLSCDVAGGLLSQSELADMYEVRIEINGLILGDGDLVRSDSSLVPVIESRPSASSPDKLTLLLVDMSGGEAARLGFVSGSGFSPGKEDPSLRAVRSLQGTLPSFALPDGLAEGYYQLETRLHDASGRILSETATLVLVYNGALPSPRIETFPSSPAKGQPVYLRLVSSLPGAYDPWLRWYVGGGLRKEGFASEFADRLVWQLPQSDGFFSVRAELFPFKPPEAVSTRSGPAGKPLKSAFRADVVLAVGPVQSASFRDGIEWAYWADFKSEPETQRVEVLDGTPLTALRVGRPYPESHENGFGHALQPGSGYLIPGIIIPRSGKPFALAVAFDPLGPVDASGSLVTLSEAEGTPALLRLGVSGGFPYVEAGGRLVQSSARLPAGLSHLVLEVLPSEANSAEALVSLFLNNELVSTAGLPRGLFARPDPVLVLLGGPEGLPAVYDSFALMHGRYQAFLVANALEYGSTLVAASGFEGGALGKGLFVQGPAQAGNGFLRLSPGSSLEIPVPASGFSLALQGYGAPLGLFLVMEDDSLLVLPGGTALPGAGPETIPGVESGSSSGGFPLPAGSMVSSEPSIFLLVEAVAGGLRIIDANGSSERISTSQAASRLRIQPARAAGSTIQTVLVRTFRSAGSLSQIAAVVPVQQADAGN